MLIHRHEHWVFGPFELIPDRSLLEKQGVRVAISPKPLAVLVHLIRNRHRVVPRAELLEHVWPSVHVSDAAFLSVLRDLRRALEDEATSPRYVATERGRGLRFVGSVYLLPSPGAAPSNPDEREVWESTALHLERALHSLDEVDRLRGASPGDAPRSRAELMVALGRAHWAAGRPDEARRVFLGAADLARESHDFETLGWAALGYVGRTDAPLVVNTHAVGLLEEALGGMASEHVALRAELLARLGTELYYEGDGSRSMRLTAEAVALAETSGSDTTLAYTLTAQHYAMTRPEVHPADRLPLAERAVGLLSSEPATDVLCLALQQHQLDLLELGDGPAYREVLRVYADAADSMELPFFRWFSSVFESNRLLLSGQVDEAERLAHETLDLGQRIATPNAIPMFSAQLIALRSEQERFGEMVPLVEAVAAQNPELPVFRCVWAAALAAAGEGAEAARLLGELVHRGLEDLPRDMHYLASLGLLATAAAQIGSAPAIAALEAALQPFAGLIISLGHGAGIHGAVGHHLGMLAVARGATAEARDHLEAARDLHARLGATLWQARSERAIEALQG